jgi:glycosyltransferase involved in cell wall biosynthesis
MHIGLNAIGFTPGRTGGMEVYFKNLLQGLQLIDHKNEYTMLCNRENADYFALFSQSFHRQIFSFNRFSALWYIRGIFRNVFNFDIMKWRFRGLSFQVLHHPSTVFVPLGVKIPFVVTYHDMQHVFYPGFFSKKQLQVRVSTDRAALKEARKIIAISQFTKQCLMEKYSVSDEKIEVVYHGVASDFCICSEQRRMTEIAEKYGLDKPFLLYPAAFWPHKNHLTLFNGLKKCSAFDGQLVLTGIDVSGKQGIDKAIQECGLADRVKILGFVPESDFPLLYNLARGLIYPSLFEGFGLPIVEAMASGCPVACSNAASLPEVAGDAGIYFDPLSPESIVEAVSLIWQNEQIRKEKTILGLKQAQRFSLEAMAEKTLRIYESAL